MFVGWSQHVRTGANDGVGIGDATVEQLLVSVHKTSLSQDLDGIVNQQSIQQLVAIVSQFARSDPSWKVIDTRR